jgi:agmatine deiminase
MWARAVEAIREVANVYIALRYSSSVSTITSFLTSLGISTDNVEFLVTGTMFNVWVRDYGPEFVYKENGTPVVVEGGYYEEFPQYIANLWGLEHFHAPISMQGGNYMTDGAREVSVSGRYVSDPQYWHNTVRTYFDLPLHIVPYLVGEVCGHIDMYARFVAPGKVVISQYTDPTHNDNMDLAAAEFQARGFEVFRVMTPPISRSELPPLAQQNPRLLHCPTGDCEQTGETRSVYRTYTNGIQCNGKYLLPVYNHPYDALAIDTFQNALPDHEIVPINCNTIILYGGALHCTSSDGPPGALACPAGLTISVSSTVQLTWESVPSAMSYAVFRRSDPCGFDVGLDDACITGSTTWIDPNSGSTDPVVYQVLSMNEHGVYSSWSDRIGMASYDISLE